MNLYLITGTTTGIGAALRDELVRDAANRAVTLSRAADSEAASGVAANVFLDFVQPKTTDAAFSRAMQHAGSGPFAQAVLINNAGVAGPVGRFDTIEGEALHHNLLVNLLGPMRLTSLFANATRGMAASRLVINISSGAAKRAIAGWSAYCTAKSGLEMATRVAALETGTNDPTLKICSLAPGVVDTPMQGRVRSASKDDFPDVERFRSMKSEGVLRPSSDVAREIIAHIKADRFHNGGNHDLREMQNA